MKDWKISDFLQECLSLQKNPYTYDYNSMKSGICNGHQVTPYKRAIASIIIDGRVINMGIINKQFPNGTTVYIINNCVYTSIEYINYLLIHN